MGLKFFREMEDFDQSVGRLIDEVPEIEIPRGRRSPPVPLEAEGEECDESDIEYTRREGGQLFRIDRSALPRWFVDPRVQVRSSPGMGKGCFATSRIEKNTLIESAPVILVHGDTFQNLNEYNGGTHKLSEYPFSWGRDGMCAIALGYGGIYNHSPDPNTVWRPSYEHESIQYTTSREIEEGEEIFIRYLPLNRLDSLWFEDEASIEAANVWRDQRSSSAIDINSLDRRSIGRLTL
jgi:hypothetical protein